MTLTNEDIKIIKILVEKELEEIKKDGKKVMIVNSPFLNKVAGDDADLPFLSSEVKYKQYLEQLVNKL